MMFRLLVGTALFAALASAQDGQKEFQERCGSCHGADGAGGERGPSILGRLTENTRTDMAIRNLIRTGLPTKGMPAIQVPETKLRALVTYVRSLVASAAKAPIAEAPVKAPGPGDWPTYNGDPSGNRHSPLREINAGNIAHLAMRWMFQISDTRRLEVTPVVVGGIMYVTAANEAYALDARTGRQIWHYRRPRSKGLVGDASSGINRGVAIAGDQLFMVTDNAHLIALRRSDGTLVWDVEMADSGRNYGATSAPLVVKDLVVSGTSGGDEGVRGFIAAYKVSSGERVWQFWTVPAAGSAGSETWSGKAVEHGCVTTWFTGSYDATTNLLYWATGNPCPDYNGDERKGDNLYSDSVLALDPDTGHLKWHYQFTPHDLHDWDSTETPVLVDAKYRGIGRKLLLHADRNGFMYVLDRITGELLLAKPFVHRLTWASGIGNDARPILAPNSEPTEQGTRTCPAVEGATNWMSPALNPSTKLFYVQALEKCNIYIKSDAVWSAGKSYYGGSTRDVPDDPGQKVLRAIDIETGRIRWEYPQRGRADSWGGVLSTATGLVFYCDDDGAFAALDAVTGKALWRVYTNQTWKASPMTYAVDGKQYVAVAAGSNILTFALP